MDSVEAGNARSEAVHGYAGHDAASGLVDGKSYRQTRGWMRYALTTFDDTEVTLACAFVTPSDSVARGYDVVVEDSLIATRTLAASGANAGFVEIRVPFAVTKGKTNIAVIIRARDGLTPALRELRTIQDHNEHDRSLTTYGATR